jgi:hypothetical protein
MQNTTATPRNLWARIILMVGGIAMLLGALDPLEGSIVILIGSALVALGTCLSRDERRFLGYRLWVLALITIGVGAMWALSARGGIGGKSGQSMWWGVLILPYLAGWYMGVCGPGNSRWFNWLGIGVGLWYLFLGCMVLTHPHRNPATVTVCILGAVGVATIGGCLLRLNQAKAKAGGEG